MTRKVIGTQWDRVNRNNMNDNFEYLFNNTGQYEAFEAAEYARDQGAHAEEQGDYAKNQGDYAKKQGKGAEHASESIDSSIDEVDTFIRNTRFIEEYDLETSYSLNNFVRFDGSTFISLSNDNSGNKPNRDTDTDHWALAARRGLDGNGNVDSVNGKTGEVVLDKDDIILGNVDNAKQATKTEFDSHANNKSNPHGVTKAQVGLGNVQNYGVATQTEAEGGTSSSKYMTPQRTKQAIDVVIDNETVNIGSGSQTHDYSGVSVGRDSTNYGGVSVGAEAISRNEKSVAIGKHSEAGQYGVSVGYGAISSRSGITVGTETEAGTSSIAIGIYSQAMGDSSVAIGDSSWTDNNREGVFGSSGPEGTNSWKVEGSFSTSGTKNFEMPHPKPSKQSTHRIRHSAVESPTSGDTLYRFKVEAEKDNDIQYIDLPDYFIYLNKDVQILVTSQGHFGKGYGILDEETERLEIHCQSPGEYNVLAIGTRNDDHQSVQDWDIKGVEREIGESWSGETYAFSVEEILEVKEIKEVM